MPSRTAKPEGSCRCACQVRSFLQPALLVRLARRPAHGYELLEDLRTSSAPGCCDPGMVYRTLRRFEHQGLVRSTWNTESGGPARRVYQVTDRGLNHLHLWAQEIHSIHCALREFLADYQSLGAGQLEPTKGG